MAWHGSLTTGLSARFRAGVRSRVTNWKVAWSSLGFGDRLNLSLFLISLVALAVAFWSVGVAIVTLREARSGGDKQQKALDSSLVALNQANVSIDASRKLLDKQVEVQSATLKSAQAAKELLQEETEAARTEVALLQSIEEQPNRRGSLALRISCKDSALGSLQTSTPLVGETERHKFHPSVQSSFDLKLIIGRPYRCEMQVTNIGTKPIESFNISLRYEPTSLQAVEFCEEDSDCEEGFWNLFAGSFISISKVGGLLSPSTQDSSGQSAHFQLRISPTEKWGHNPGSGPQRIGEVKVRVAPQGVIYDFITLNIYMV